MDSGFALRPPRNDSERATTESRRQCTKWYQLIVWILRLVHCHRIPTLTAIRRRFCGLFSRLLALPCSPFLRNQSRQQEMPFQPIDHVI
jgi:hypothetical protein